MSNPQEVRTRSDGYWEWFVSPERPGYSITGKYLLFATDRDLLVRIATEEIEEGPFHLAKIPLPGKNIHPEYVLCLYHRDDSMKHELADKYKGRDGLRYKYWKSDAATRRGEYSEAFLKKLSPENRKKFERER